jgi:hypothetical protein
VITGPERRDLLPIACTLGPVDGRERIGEWRSLYREFGLRRAHRGGLVTIQFRDAPRLAAELARLVWEERVCCAFLDWQLECAVDVWTLTITGDDEALRSLPITAGS